MARPASSLPHRRPSAERGQAVPLLAAVVVVAGLAVLGLGVVGRRTVDAARARTAADAAALAGVVDGEAAARRLAAANRGTLVSFTVTDGDVLVRVLVGRATASARARLSLDG